MSCLVYPADQSRLNIYLMRMRQHTKPSRRSQMSPLGHGCHMYLLLCLISAIEDAEIEAEPSPQNEHG